MRAKNINGISANRCPCGSWLQHWMDFSGQALPRFCAEANCAQRPTSGAHVQRDWALDDKWYIVPLCARQSGLTGQSIELALSAILVPANLKETCGKRTSRPA